MTFQETLDYLYSRLPMYQRVGKSAYKKDLTNTLKLLDALENPQSHFKCVHIAGTNGKGTSAHGIAAILQLSGYKTGLYTSPHLKRFTERIRVNGVEITEEEVSSFVETTKPHIEQIQPSFFELTVAMAFTHFADQSVDIAIIETGLGGRLDSTNVISPEVSLITNIGYDHMDMLGDTLEQSAAEKAGIIKPNTPVVIGEVLAETRPVFEAKAAAERASIHFPESIDWQQDPLTPSYFRKNVPGIWKVCDILDDLGFPTTTARRTEGLRNVNTLTGLKGRFQVLNDQPLMIADISHNVDGLEILFDQITSLNRGQLHIVYGTVQDKVLAPILDLIPSGANIYWTQSNVPRALKVEELAIQAVVHGLQGECFKDVNEAIRAAKQTAKAGDTIVVTGSTFVVAEIEGL